VHLVGGMALACEGAFEMGDEACSLRPQIFIVQHAPASPRSVRLKFNAS